MKKNMEKKWTFSADTIENAIAKAVKETGLGREELCVRVVSEEKRGLFGMAGAEPVKIVVTLKASLDI